MNKFSACMIILIGLFTFQSIWSVADAACLHEMPDAVDRNALLDSDATAVQQIYPDETSLQSAPSILQSENLKIRDYCQKVCFNEKCNHFTNHFALDLEQRAQHSLIRSSFVAAQPTFVWSNFYQSPDLTRLSPPPEQTPL